MNVPAKECQISWVPAGWSSSLPLPFASVFKWNSVVCDFREPLNRCQEQNWQAPEDAQFLSPCFHAHGKLNIVVLFVSFGLAICLFLFLVFVTSDLSAVGFGCFGSFGWLHSRSIFATLDLVCFVACFCQLPENENNIILPESSIFEVAVTRSQTNMLLLYIMLLLQYVCIYINIFIWIIVQLDNSMNMYIYALITAALTPQALFSP